jgi:hypothetical protein
MKKQNKEIEVWKIIGIILVSIIFVFSFLYLIFVTLPALHQPTITITTEVCHNETNISEISKCWNIGDLLNSMIYDYDELGCFTKEKYNLTLGEDCLKLKYLIKDKKKKYNNCFDELYNKTIKVCEQKEVDEFKVLQPLTLYFDNCYVEDTENGVLMTINKECLQKNPEWLDENCECLNGTFISELDCSKVDNFKDCETKHSVKDCKKYSCISDEKEFIVEVKR